MSGIPYRCATTVNGAYSCQSPGVSKTSAEWGDLVRGSHAGPYPRVQIWHGASDSTVVPMNSDELVKQWTNAMGIDATADQTETVNGATRNAYMSGSTIMLETYRVSGMGHAVAAGPDAVGACPTTVGSYFANKGICATVRAAMFFGLATGGTGPGPGPGGTDTVKPSVVITSPSDGDEVTGALTIVVAATDDVAVDHVSLSIDGAEIGEVVDAPYQFAWTASGGGEHTIVATAVDASSNEATSEITVTVPGPGGGSGSNGNNPANGDLPGCTLDIGGHHRGGTSATPRARRGHRAPPPSSLEPAAHANARIEPVAVTPTAAGSLPLTRNTVVTTALIAATPNAMLVAYDQRLPRCSIACSSAKS